MIGLFSAVVGVGLGILLLGPVGVGLGILLLGLVLPDRVDGLAGALLAWLAPLGLVIALLGTLTMCVPGFFR